MGIPFIPRAGMVLMCDFATGFIAPEMVKVRPVVVLSKRRWNRRTCIVIPCSSITAFGALRVTVPLPRRKYAFLRQDSWAKCDCPYTVSLRRLRALRDSRAYAMDSRRTMLEPADLLRIRKCVVKAIGLLDGDKPL
jgi:uncharacterized protein YifN (PemK superfamily)